MLHALYIISIQLEYCHSFPPFLCLWLATRLYSLAHTDCSSQQRHRNLAIIGTAMPPPPIHELDGTNQQQPSAFRKPSRGVSPKPIKVVSISTELMSSQKIEEADGELEQFRQAVEEEVTNGHSMGDKREGSSSSSGSVTGNTASRPMFARLTASYYMTTFMSLSSSQFTTGVNRLDIKKIGQRAVLTGKKKRRVRDQGGNSQQRRNNSTQDGESLCAL
ncbi:hypothetical protein BT69DRAFT_1326345 [Atractiella rhizophila]|nr:hypothetical protein BT69DRAFT_1326345 [Atractiella rhizophila]